VLVQVEGVKGTVCEAQPALPDDVDSRRSESAVATDESGLFSFRLGNEQTVEWIIVMQRQFIQYIDVLELHRQNSQIIGRLLAPYHLVESDTQFEPVDLSLDLDIPSADNAQIQLVG
jgi:hypothetical protein